jgi:endogenous inhibitor of DNA gyrase (YacG/DUF329 family)
MNPTFEELLNPAPEHFKHTCEICGKPFENNEPFQWRIVCGKECEAIQEEREAAERELERDRIATEWLASFRLKVIDSMPPLFQATNIDHQKFNRAAWDKIKLWEPMEEKPWAGFTGDTGKCKSRIAHLLALADLERLAKQRAPRAQSDRFQPGFAPDYVFTPSYRISETVMAQFGGKFEGGSRSIHDDRSPAQHARAWLDKLRDVDVLLIDDLGKGKLSPAVASEMLALVDHRHVNQLVTIWTSNSAPETIAECMTPDMAAPFAGRINESSQIFHFK